MINEIIEMSPNSSVLLDNKGSVSDSKKQEFITELENLDRIQNLSKNGSRGQSMQTVEISKLLKCLRHQRMTVQLSSVLEVEEYSVTENFVDKVRGVRNSLVEVSKNSMSPFADLTKTNT